MLFIFDMGGVVTNTFKMDSIYQKLNISKNDFSEICKKNNNDFITKAKNIHGDKYEYSKIKARWHAYLF